MLREADRVIRALLKRLSGTMSEDEARYRRWRMQEAKETFGHYMMANGAEREFHRGRHAALALEVPSAAKMYREYERVDP